MRFVGYFIGRITDAPTAKERMLAFVEWYLLSFHAGRQVLAATSILLFQSISKHQFLGGDTAVVDAAVSVDPSYPA